MRRLSMPQWTIQFFPFWGGREAGFFFPLVSNVFPSSFQDPKVFPIVLGFISYDLPKVQLTCIKTKKCKPRVYIHLYFATGVQRGTSVGVRPTFQKEIGSIRKTRKSRKCTHDLICLWTKEGCLFCFVCSDEIHQTEMLQIAFLVSLEALEEEGCISLVSCRLDLHSKSSWILHWKLN
jgi:hypothetical protein